MVEIGPVALEKRKKMWKVYNHDNHDRKIVIRKALLSLWLKWAKNCESNSLYIPPQPTYMSKFIYVHKNCCLVVIYLMSKSIVWKSRPNIKIIQRSWIFMTHRCFVKFPINLTWSQRLTAYWDPEYDTLTHSDKPSCQIWYAYVIGKRGYLLDTKTGKKFYKFDLIKVKDHCCITIMNVQYTMFYFDTPTCQIC